MYKNIKIESADNGFIISYQYFDEENKLCSGKRLCVGKEGYEGINNAFIHTCIELAELFELDLENLEEDIINYINYNT